MGGDFGPWSLARIGGTRSIPYTPSNEPGGKKRGAGPSAKIPDIGIKLSGAVNFMDFFKPARFFGLVLVAAASASSAAQPRARRRTTCLPKRTGNMPAATAGKNKPIAAAKNWIVWLGVGIMPVALRSRSAASGQRFEVARYERQRVGMDMFLDMPHMETAANLTAKTPPASRGGLWYYNPQSLRSANRSGSGLMLHILA